MKSLGRGWIVLSLPTKALLCLPVLAGFHYRSARLKRLLEVPVFCYIIQKSSADNRYLCGPALALICRLALLLLSFFQH